MDTRSAGCLLLDIRLDILVEARPGEREGRDEKDVGKRVESAWSCWKGSEKNHMHTTMRFLGMAFRFPILACLGRVRW